MELVYLQPHMHVRGKDMEFRLYYPSGEVETIYKGAWDYDRQLGYTLAEPISLPVGTRMVASAHFNNSLSNSVNPDPTKLVFFGPQNWDEMQNMFVGVLVDPKVDVTTIFEPTGPSVLP